MATIWRLLGPRPILLGAVVGFTGLIVQFALMGLARAELVGSEAAAPRYVYTGVFFVLLILTAWLATLAPALQGRRQQAMLCALLALALVANQIGLLHLRSYLTNLSNQTAAAMQLLTRYGGTPSLPDNVGWMSVPTKQQLTQLTAAFGSPLEAAPHPPDSVLDAMLWELVGHALKVTAASSPSTLQPAPVDSTVDASATQAADCTLVEPTGTSPLVATHMSAGQTIFVDSGVAGSAEIRVSLYGTFNDKGTRPLTLIPGQPLAVHLPDIGAGITWLVEYRASPAGLSRLCVAQ